MIHAHIQFEARESEPEGWETIEEPKQLVIDENGWVHLVLYDGLGRMDRQRSWPPHRIACIQWEYP